MSVGTTPPPPRPRPPTATFQRMSTGSASPLGPPPGASPQGIRLCPRHTLLRAGGTNGETGANERVDRASPSARDNLKVTKGPGAADGGGRGRGEPDEQDGQAKTRGTKNRNKPKTASAEKSV